MDAPSSYIFNEATNGNESGDPWIPPEEVLAEGVLHAA
jgi:hypothetical protein